MILLRLGGHRCLCSMSVGVGLRGDDAQNGSCIGLSISNIRWSGPSLHCLWTLCK